jgi:hypothetical protein
VEGGTGFASAGVGWAKMTTTAEKKIAAASRRRAVLRMWFSPRPWVARLVIVVFIVSFLSVMCAVAAEFMKEMVKDKALLPE